MESLIVLSIIFIVLFLANFITKRKFGVLGLALGAGSTLAVVWNKEISYLISVIGIRQSDFSDAIISIVVTLIPAIILLIHGVTYKNKMLRFVGSASFGLLAVTLIMPLLNNILNFSGLGLDISRFLSSERDFIVGFGLIFAVVDIFFTKSAPKLPEKHHKH